MDIIHVIKKGGGAFSANFNVLVFVEHVTSNLAIKIVVFIKKVVFIDILFQLNLR